MKRKTRYPDPRYSDKRSAPDSYSPDSKSSPFSFSYITMAILGGIFILGIGVGIAFMSTTNLNPESVHSSVEIDQQAPNPELCQQFGASAMVTDMRVFVTLNPFSVFVSQPRMQPGCVLRRNNWAVLERQKLLSNEQENDCKRRMNTFAFTGPLEGSPQINCVYQNDAAGNLFVRQQGGVVSPPPESDSY